MEMAFAACSPHGRNPRDPNTQKMFEAMMAADRMHAERLLEALSRLAPPPRPR